MAAAALAILVSYLLGAVPFGFVMARVLRGVDLRTVGSGNIGATNAMRVLGKPLGVVAFLLDFAKGWVPSFLLAPLAASEAVDLGWLRVLCGAAAVVGHVWPVYLRFRGGKAVATGCGAIVGVDPLVFVGAGLVWLLTLATTRFVSLASMAMGVSFPVLAALRMGPERHGFELVLGTGALALLILLRHRSNLGRLLAGTEPRAGRSKERQGAG
ncbi:MAG: glycerol-3-phosphate 1-O-acyltransferase PlsY [Planctomycetota bacterium]